MEEQEPELPQASVLGKRRGAPETPAVLAGTTQRRPRRRTATAVAPPTTAEQEREQQRQAEEAEAEAENEEERLAALDLALSTIPAEIRQALPLVDTRVLLESQVGLRLADTVAEVERLRADFARADAERERLLSYVNQLEQDLVDTQFANIEDDPRYQALQGTRREALGLIEQQIRDTVLYQNLEREVVALREELVAALQRAERAEAEAQAAQERFLRDMTRVQETLSTIAVTTASAAGTDAMSALGWQTFGLLALADLARQAATPQAVTDQDITPQAVSPEGVTPQVVGPPYYYMAPPDAVFAEFVAEAAQRASDLVENTRIAEARQSLDEATGIINNIDAALATLSLDESRRQLYDEVAARTEETVTARSVQLQALEAAADVERLAATYRTTMAQSYEFMRAASMLDNPIESERIMSALPATVTQGPRAAFNVLAAAIWSLRGRTGPTISIPRSVPNVIRAWTAARIMRALWWPIARAVLDPQATPNELRALWDAMAPYDEFPPEAEGTTVTPEVRTAFYNRLQAVFVAAFRPPTPESLLRVWQAVDATRTPDGLARLICGITRSGSARFVDMSRDLKLACVGLDQGTSTPAVVFDQVAWLFGFGLPPWNSEEFSVSRAILRSPGGAPEAPKTLP
ncbi:hypothetical protein pqer_cds_371 [Pandoravirus quercus]|uniref:SMC N incomplete domain containing protein n=1 Tax=Pandoravirus quercus TaxID=2107709 RepID=A0A2U7U8N6_9VIRU|nr:hypothetical protein pqer_cds_371 [Pandoravirus quercus]AVK74793.1 hypothetical protein pqer_cds_371 [Pandoravirus quercus]